MEEENGTITDRKLVTLKYSFNVNFLCVLETGSGRLPTTRLFVDMDNDGDDDDYDGHEDDDDDCSGVLFHSRRGQ